MSKDYPRHLSLDNREMVRVIKDGGKIVSHVATSVRPVTLGGVSTSVAGIGAVATLQEARGKGYASMLMADAIERSVAAGADIMLISGDEGIYKRIHAVECGCFSELYIEKEKFSERVGRYEITQVSSSDITGIIQLRQALATRYLLPLEDIEALHDCKWVMDKPTEWWAVKDANQIVGFGVTYKDGTDIYLLDWAGCSEALIELTGHCFEHLRAEKVIYIAPDASLLPLEWRDWIRRSIPFDGLVIVIQAERLLQRAAIYIEERIGEKVWSQIEIEAENQKVVFKLDNESAVFENGGELAYLFFGQLEGDVIIEKTSETGRLRTVLKQVFPIPLVWYGLGYV